MAGRKDLMYIGTSCTRGINDQIDKMLRDECVDARNVWAPQGVVEQRPGSVGINFLGPDAILSTTGQILTKEESGTFTTVTPPSQLTLSNLAVGDRWYAGWNEDPVDNEVVRVPINLSSNNSNTTAVRVEYHNGTQWVNLPFSEQDGSDGPHVLHLNGAALMGLVFVTPQDWAKTTVDGNERYFVRMTIVDVALDSSVQTSAGTFSVRQTERAADDDDYANVRGVFNPQFLTQKHWFVLVDRSFGGTTNRLTYSAMGSLQGHGRENINFSNNVEGGPATLAVVPQFNEAFMAYGGFVTNHTPTDTSSSDIIAEVEDDPNIVGDKADYDKNYIAQLSVFPKAKYITFFKNRLWFAGIEGEPFTVRWGAPAPFHKVLPSISLEILAENDNSPLTGIFGFGEHLVVGKNDSLWQMVFDGPNFLGLAGYSPIRIPSGVGPVSQGGMVEANGVLYFMAEDGVYAFNGVSVSEKPISTRIGKTIRRISPGRRKFITSAHWHTQGVVMWGVSIDGSEANNLLIVYDYQDDAWWLWDGIEPQFLFTDESGSDDEKIYYGDSAGNIYELGVGNHDHGAAIESYVVTSRLGRSNAGHRKALRTVYLEASNLSRELTVEVRRQTSRQNRSSTYDFTDKNEVKYGEVVSGTSQYVDEMMRVKRKDFNEVASHHQVKVSHSEKNTPFTLLRIEPGFRLLGHRR